LKYTNINNNLNALQQAVKQIAKYVVFECLIYLFCNGYGRQERGAERRYLPYRQPLGLIALAYCKHETI